MKLNLHLTKQLRNFYSLIGIMVLLFSSNVNAQVAQTYTTSTTWLCPAGVFSVQVESWGAGGGGGGAAAASTANRSGGGGGAGSYVKKTIAVVPGTTYTVTVGAGGAKGGTSTASGYYGGPGGKSEFSGPSITAITASGGTGGTGAGSSNIITNPGGVLGGVYGFTMSGTKTTNYTSSSVVTLTGGGGTGAATTFNTNSTSGLVTYIAATNQGTGYSSAPSVAVSVGAGLTFTALVNPNINSSGADTTILGLSGGASTASAGGAGGASPDGLGGFLPGVAGGTGTVSGTKYEPAQATNAGAGGGGGFSYYASSPTPTSGSGGLGGNGKIVLTYTATVPTISVTPATLSGFSTVPDAPSTAQTFSVSGSLLEADIVITAPTNYEINNPLVDGTYGSSITLTQSSGSVAATTINVRLKTGLTVATAYLENISVATTNGTTQTVACSGGVLAYYYYAGSGSLANVASWSTNANGSGGSTPTNFTTVYQVFVIRNTTAVSTDQLWNVAGTGSIIQVGDPAVPGVALTIASGLDISTTAVLPVVGNGVIDIPAASSGVNSVIFQSAVIPPAMGIMDANSEVHYQATMTTSTSKTFGKMFIENNSTVTFNGKPIVQSSLNVASGSTILFSNNTGDYFTVNTTATVVIDGSIKSAKAAGIFSYGVTTPGSSFGNIQFKDAVGALSLGSSSTVEYNRTGSSTAQPISTLPTGVNYNNLTLSDSGATNNKLFSGAVTVNNTLTLNQTASNVFSGGNLTLANGATIVRTGGSLDAAPVFGTTVNVSYNGATAITSGVEIPTATSVLNNLTVNNAAGVTLGGNATVNGALTFTAGKITTAANTLTLGTAGTISGAGTGWVVGNLKKLTASDVSPSYTYAIGDATNYLPLALTFSGTTSVAGGLTASTATGDHASVASSGLNPAKSVNRTYTLTNDALAGFGTYDATFNYVSTDNDAIATVANYIVRLYDGASWSTIATSGTPTTTATTATGISSFGGFAIGELGDPPIYTYDGTGDLHDVSNWADELSNAPANFTASFQTFKINTSVTTTAPWTVSGTSSKIVVGDATHTGVSLIIASGSGITATMDVTDGNKVYVQDVVLVAGSTTSYTMNFPTFGTLGDTSEVHYQNSTANNALVRTAFTYGKLYIDGSGTGTVFFSGFTNPTNHIVKTLFEVAAGSNAYFSEVSYYYMTLNTNAQATIYGTLKTGKVTGFVSSNVGTASSTFGSLQFIGTEALTLGANSTIEYNRGSSSVSTQTITPRTDYKNLTLSGLSNNKSFTGDTTVSGALTLNITGTSTSTLAANVTVNGAINFTAGKITTSTNTLTLGTAGTISGAGTGWVVGNLKKLTASGSSPSFIYAIGDATNYLPLALTFSGATSAAGGLTASTTSVDHASIAGSGIDSAKSVNRTWTLTNDALADFGTYDAAFTYATADNDAGTTPANYAVRLYNGSTWSIVTTSGTTSDAATSTTGITGFGDFVIGECTPTTTGSVTTSICEGATYVWPANGLSYTTAQSGTAFVSGCNTATLNLTVTPAPASAGTNGSLVICAGSSVNEASLFAALSGTPEAGGTWSATTGGAGTYIYTQAATSPCTTANTATVTVTEQAQPNAGTNGTLSLSASPSDATLFAALTGADAGGSWSRPSSGYVGVYTYTVNAISPCTGSDTSTVTVTSSTLLPTADTTYTLCAGAKISNLLAAATSNGSVGVKVYAAASGGSPIVLSGTTDAVIPTSTTPKAYWLTEPASTSSGESARVRIFAVVNALPATPSALVLTNDNAVSPATSSTAVTALGLYAGTSTPFKLTATAAGTGLTYKWTLPTGVVRTNSTGTTTDSNATSTDAFIYVKFTGTGSATPLVINVQSVNASGCTSLVKASASLTRLLPAAPSALAMNNGVNTTAITTFAKYMGSPTVLRLSATASVTATSYLWELPTGVNRMTALTEGVVTTDLTSTDPFIYVNFAGVTKDNTDTNSAVAVLTKVLRIGVKSVNGVGSSTTVNSGLSSTAKLLTLTAVAPAAPASLAMNNGANTTAITVISKMIGQGATVKLLAPISALASSYAWEIPACVTRVSDLGGLTADNTSTSTDPFIYVKFNGTNPAAGSIYFGVTAVNGVGSSVTVNSGLQSTAKLLKLATVVPAAPASLAMNNGTLTTAITVISKMIGQGATVKLLAPTSALANSYAWEIPACVTRVTDLGGSIADNTSTSTDPFIYVKFNGTNPAAGFIYFGVLAVNGVGSSVTVNSGLLSTAKLLKLATVVPAAPATLVLNDVNNGPSTTAVTVLGKYIGTTTKLKLTAGASVLANTYSWTLPDGVNRVDELGEIILSPISQEPFIFVNFLNVPHEDTTISLVLGVKAVNSVGSSLTVNTGANIARTDKLLTVTAGLPVVVATVSGSLSVCNRSEGFSYTITAPVGATSYIITAPAGSVVSSTNGVASATSTSSTNNVLTTSDLTFKVVYNGTAAFSTTDKSLVIRSANAFGPCLTTKALALTKTATCTSTVRLAASTEEFNVIAYPNPSSDVFTLEVQSLGKGKSTTGVQVYDMTGRLIEQRQEESNSVEVGNNYPSGVYIVIVSQGEEMKTLRVIKK